MRRLQAWLGGGAVELWAYGDSAGDDELLAAADHPHRSDDAACNRDPVSTLPRHAGDGGGRGYRCDGCSSSSAIAVIAFVAAIAIQRNVFPFYSGDHDEPVYRFQAEMLRMGEINIPLAQNQFFRPWLSGPAHGHLVMAFQPGWPSLLMVADVLTGSMLVALGTAAALATFAAFAFAASCSARPGGRCSRPRSWRSRRSP